MNNLSIASNALVHACMSESLSSIFGPYIVLLSPEVSVTSVTMSIYICIYINIYVNNMADAKSVRNLLAIFW